MKLALAQVKPVPGYLAANRERHLMLAEKAHRAGAEAIVFPELSLSGYEPALATACALSADDSFLSPFQELSDHTGLVIGTSAPVKGKAGLYIGLFFFQPGKPRQLYTKRYLYPDEEPFFVAGTARADVYVGTEKLIPAICYEISVPAHAEEALAGQRGVYVASVAKTENGMDTAGIRLPEIARQFGVPVALANCVGPNDDFVGAGKSGAWTKDGQLAGQLGGEREGLLLFDTHTSEIVILV